MAEKPDRTAAFVHALSGVSPQKPMSGMDKPSVVSVDGRARSWDILPAAAMTSSTGATSLFFPSISPAASTSSKATLSSPVTTRWLSSMARMRSAGTRTIRSSPAGSWAGRETLNNAAATNQDQAALIELPCSRLPVTATDSPAARLCRHNLVRAD